MLVLVHQHWFCGIAILVLMHWISVLVFVYWCVDVCVLLRVNGCLGIGIDTFMLLLSVGLLAFVSWFCCVSVSGLVLVRSYG